MKIPVFATKIQAFLIKYTNTLAKMIIHICDNRQESALELQATSELMLYSANKSATVNI